MSRLIPAFLCAASLTAVAQQTPAPATPTPPQPRKEEPQKLEKIEVQADGLAERRESTASKIIVNSEEIQKYGDTNLLEVLKRLPGVTVDSGPGGRGGAVRMRGLGSGYTQILVNGERMPPGFTLDSIAPDLIERIEIIRGASAEYSAQAMAGTINVVLKRALSTQRKELKLNVSLENDKPNVNVSGQWADKSGSLSWTLPFNATRFSFTGEGSSEQRVYDPDWDLTQFFLSRRLSEGFGGNVNIAPRLSWNLGTNNTLNVDAFALFNPFRGHFIEDNTPVSGPPPQYVSTDLRVANTNRTARANAQWVRRFTDGSRIDAKVGGTIFDFNSDSTFAGNDLAGITTLERTVDSTIRDGGLTTIGKYSFPVTKGHAMVTGWDGGWNEREDTRLQQDLNPVTGVATRLDEAFDTSIRRFALFGQDEWDVTDRLAVYLGLRWEGIETKSAGNTYDEIRNRSSVWSPIVNVLWKLPNTTKDQVRAGLSRTYRPPQIQELVPRRFFAPNNSPTTPDFIGNPDLKPELAWGLDAAYEHYPDAGGNMSISAYYRIIDDVIQREVVFEDGLYISRPGNVGSAVVRGLEFDAKGKLKQIWADGPDVDLRGNFAINRSKVDTLPGPNNRLDSQVPWNGTVAFDYKVPTTPLTVGSSFTARAGGTVRTSLAQTLYRSVTRQLEAYGLWRFSPTYQLRFTVQDILAQDALTVNSFTDATGTVERTTLDSRFRRFSFLWEMKL
ncbi:TonB-dependent receptor plug domain-containing protein [Usitatibacter palustris]|uniref:Vitamin B12 transporter BtuB n=1 Tax=Usitatibacter palustris TaxID=2732487 RepID=A0A6M4H9E3_9PROT|nr:TonB-dependent receptor [Usitatibacter palustris]QJR16210.1 Vitamin B12 transporter BtuB [Usitatibacter palustris]